MVHSSYHVQSNMSVKRGIIGGFSMCQSIHKREFSLILKCVQIKKATENLE